MLTGMNPPRLIALAGVAPTLHPETSCGPEIHYDGRPSFTYPDRNDEIVRVSFERWDALRVCRGEHLPFEFEPAGEYPQGAWPWCFVVDQSPWLAERYAYEKAHYGSAYNFGGNVDEMLTDFDHYVLSFHDEFVEVIAGGIWFERIAGALPPGQYADEHPARELGPERCIERFVHRGIECEVLQSQHSTEEIRERALLCAQPVVAFEFSFPGEKRGRAAFTLTMRARRGVTVYLWRSGFFDHEKARFEEMPPMEELRRRFLDYLDEVIARRELRRREK